MPEWAWKEGEAALDFSRTSFMFYKFLLQAQEASKQTKYRIKSRKIADLSEIKGNREAVFQLSLQVPVLFPVLI